MESGKKGGVIRASQKAEGAATRRAPPGLGHANYNDAGCENTRAGRDVLRQFAAIRYPRARLCVALRFQPVGATAVPCVLDGREP